MTFYNKFEQNLNEKYEDRHWNRPNSSLGEIENESKIDPLPITEDQYLACIQIIAKKAIDNNDPKACEEYFELKRRAVFGNRYYKGFDGMEEIERQMWQIGHDEKTVDNGRKR